MAMISKEYSRMVYFDGIESVNDESHPCHHFYQWQQKNGFSPYQMPEPFSGLEARLGIAFIGLNPSITLDQVIPCFDEKLNFDKFDDYYRNRFIDSNRDEKAKLIIHRNDGTTGKPKLWNSIEKFGQAYLSNICQNNFKLGTHAILSQAIRFKSKNGWYGDTSDQKARTIKHQQIFLDKLIDNEGIKILIPMGNDALRVICQSVNFYNYVPSKITDAMGKSYEGKTKSGKQVIICPIKHLSYPALKPAQLAVSKRILEIFRDYS